MEHESDCQGSQTQSPTAHRQHHGGTVSSSPQRQRPSLQPYFTQIPEVLEFDTWWMEGSTKRYMLILFYHAHNQFQILTDDAKIPLCVTCNNRYGEPLQAWDLYIGCTIDILQRSTTLMSASRSTMKWLDTNAVRLWKQKEALEARLNKFRIVPRHALHFGHYKKLLNIGSGGLGGKVDLAKLATTIFEIEEELREYQ